MDEPRSPDPVSPDQIDQQHPLAGRPCPSIRLRAYTDEQIEHFARADTLDGEALRIARQFDMPTGGRSFQTCTTVRQ